MAPTLAQSILEVRAKFYPDALLVEWGMQIQNRRWLYPHSTLEVRLYVKPFPDEFGRPELMNTPLPDRSTTTGVGFSIPMTGFTISREASGAAFSPGSVFADPEGRCYPVHLDLTSLTVPAGAVTIYPAIRWPVGSPDWLRTSRTVMVRFGTEIAGRYQTIAEYHFSSPPAESDVVVVADAKPRRVFISYARNDHADEGRAPDCFVQKLYRALAAAGFTPFLDHHDMPSRGTPFPKEIRDAVQESKQFIAVCGPAYPASEWARAERDHAHSNCITIVPVLAAGEFETEVPKDIALLNGIDMHGDFDAHWPELLKRIEPFAPIPGKVISSAGVMPDADERDLPRAALFEQIKAALRKDQTDPIAIAGTRALTAMYAAGGIGKTTLAA